MKIMAKQVTNVVGSTKPPNGRHTQTVSEALQEFCRVHFPDCRLIARSTDGQGQLNLAAR
jgi:hypothetical protein